MNLGPVESGVGVLGTTISSVPGKSQESEVKGLVCISSKILGY